MLYLAFPSDLRDRYQNSEWLVYSKQIQETQFTPEDTLVLSEWVVPERAELVQIVYRARGQGARVIYVGSRQSETDDLKRQLCLMGAFDFAFFGDEIALSVIDGLIEHPRTPADVREYMAQDVNVLGEAPIVVDEVDSDDLKQPHQSKELGFRNELRGFRDRLIDRASRWGGGKKLSTSALHVVQPRVIAVVGLWPRSGTSTIAQLLARGFAEHLPKNVVGLVEHPDQWPRMWDHFQLDGHVLPEKYRHWLQDGVGQSITREGVNLVPLPPMHSAGDKKFAQEIVQYVYRQMRGSITVIDCGQNDGDELLLNMVDRVVGVMDCDPTFLSVDELGDKYRNLIDRYKDRFVTVLNKWTPFVTYPPDLFAKAVKVPYLPPEHVQQALWTGQFIDVSTMRDELSALEATLIKPFLPLSVGTLLEEHERLRSAAVHDTLTGCLNRKGLMDWFVERDRRSGEEGFILALFDLDRFKQLNDTQGHLVGDEALKAIAGTFQGMLRSCDLIARLGGDEFVVILDNSGCHPDVKGRLEEFKARLPLQKYGLGLTMGVACYPSHGKTLEELLAAADARLYDGKRSGRGKIVLWEGA